MPIVFSCQCGKKLQAKEEYAGKSVKCPGCGQVVKIPAVASGTPIAGPKAPAQAPMRAPSSVKQTTPAPSALKKPAGGIAEKPVATPKKTITKKKHVCSACGAEVFPDDVICINCGNKLKADFGPKEEEIPWHKKPIAKQMLYLIILIIIILAVYKFIIRAPKGEEEVMREEPIKEVPTFLA